jgi:hypothetical protein
LPKRSIGPTWSTFQALSRVPPSCWLFVLFVLVGIEANAATAMLASLVGVWLVIVGQFFVLRHRLTKLLGAHARRRA